MAAGHLSPPGTEYGPCYEPCGHNDCFATRTMAISKCRICLGAIGYDRRFYKETDGLVHASCLEGEVDTETAIEGLRQIAYETRENDA